MPSFKDDPFQVESGLLDDADVIVRDAEFTKRPDAFAPDKLELHLTVFVEGDDGGEQVLFFGCGDGWESNDGGKTASREDGKDRGFHQNTKVGELFHGLCKVMADDKEADKALRARTQEYPTAAREAGFWKGLKLHLSRSDRKGGGEVGDYAVLVVDGFNGIEGGAAKATKKAAKKAAPAKAKTAEAEGGLTDEILAKLDAIADASADHDSFMEAAFAEVPEASTDEVVKAAVADEGVDGDDSIWQRAITRYNASVAAG